MAVGLSLKVRLCSPETRNSPLPRKHIKKHLKPYKCDVPGCKRATEGLSSTSDLHRHVWARHNIGGDSKVKYICLEGDCARKNKTMTRWDNMSAHLRSVHRLDRPVRENYIYRQAVSRRFAHSPWLLASLACLTSSVTAAPLQYLTTTRHLRRCILCSWACGMSLS